ncbi:MAG: AAA family ATPase [bacterium]|nr:AAA family ATPase [bacterium]
MGAPPSYVGYGDPPLLAQEKLNAPAAKHYEKGDPKVHALDREIEKLEKQLAAALVEKNEKTAGALAQQLANRAMRKETYIQGKLKYDRRPTGIILFDEFEKGHESLMHFLLEITENGKATLGDGSETDLTKFFVIMTSNIASQQIAKTVKGGGKIGFGVSDEMASIDRVIYENAMSEAKKRFSTEFLNRVLPVVFRILTTEQLAQIRDIKIARIEKKLKSAGFNVELIISQKARDFVLSQSLDHPENGAREIGRKVDKYIRDGIGNLIVSREIVPGKHTKIFVELEESEGKPRIVFERENN